ncbi:dihydroneopterin aldolase [bacterium]|nr:dihydroneopterin aldolase [bacterium]|tara:strand:- start:5929 stop:6336 length:408 start_codon:yes stop_codon:yes gene_type:complete
MLGEIIIDELQVTTIIGCMDSERTTKQPLIISLAIQYDMQEAAKTDTIEKALNYAQLSEDIKTYVESSEHYILESLAQRIFDIVFNYPQALKASLFIYKPDAISYTKRVGLKLSQVRKPLISHDKSRSDQLIWND